MTVTCELVLFIFNFFEIVCIRMQDALPPPILKVSETELVMLNCTLTYDDSMYLKQGCSSGKFTRVNDR